MNDCTLAPFRELLLQRCGLSFAGDREKTLIDGISQRMSLRGSPSAKDYHALAAKDPGEFQHLIELLTVNETYFFREPDHLRVMIEKIAPEIAKERKETPVRIVSMGCSTGEEPYSIAMMLNERFGAESERRFTIAGGDIDTCALAVARRGIYGPGSFRGMDEAIRRRYFTPCAPDRYQLGEIRHRVKFEVANLLGEPYPPLLQKPDIILYRNVSIYFPKEVQREIFGRLAALLNQGGALFVGASETMHHDIGILSLTERDGLFFFQKSGAGETIGDRRASRRHIPATVPSASGPSPRRLPPRASAASDPAPDKGRFAAKGTAAPSPPPLAADEREVRRLFDEALHRARSGRQDEALALIDRLIEMDATFVKGYSLKGSILMSVSHYREAAAVCRAALRLDPLCLEAALMLGIIARHEEDEAEAHRRFREAVYLNPSCWLGHFYLAGIALAQGDRKRAKSGYETTLRILEQGGRREHDQEFFPLSFNAGEFMTICRHKLSQLKETR